VAGPEASRRSASTSWRFSSGVEHPPGDLKGALKIAPGKLEVLEVRDLKARVLRDRQIHEGKNAILIRSWVLDLSFQTWLTAGPLRTYAFHGEHL